MRSIFSYIYWHQCSLVILKIILILSNLVSFSSGKAAQLALVNKKSSSLWIVDTKSFTKVDSIQTEYYPHEVVLSPKKNLLAVSIYGSFKKPGNTLNIFSMNPLKLEKVVSLDPYTRPHGMYWLKKSPHLLVTAEDDRKLLFVNTNTWTIDHAVDTGAELSHMVIADDIRQEAFVTSILSGSLSSIDLKTHSLKKVIDVGPGSEGVSLSSDSLWVSSREDGIIHRIDPLTLKTKQTFSTGGYPIRLVNDSNKDLFVSLFKKGQIARIKEDQIEYLNLNHVKPHFTSLYGPLKHLKHLLKPYPSKPIGMLLVPEEQTLIVALSGYNKLVEIQIKNTMKIGRQLETEGEPDTMTLL